MKTYNYLKSIERIKNREGLTLMEVIISLAILGIITVSIITIFSNSFSNVFSMGNRSKALAEASRKMEILYTIPVEERNIDTLKDALVDATTVYVEGEAALYQSTSDNIVRFMITPQTLLQDHDEENTGFAVTIVVFYQDGGRRVTLDTFLRGGS